MAEKKPKKLGPFDILGSINAGPKTKDLLDGIPAGPSDSLNLNSNEKAYVPFIINRGLSYFADTVLLANEMNMHASLPPRMQYDFFRNTVRPRRRFSKWFKAMKDSDDLTLIKEHYGYNTERATEALSLFDEESLVELREKCSKGGKV